MEAKKWYAAFIKPGSEKSAIKVLERKQVNCYYALYKEECLLNGRVTEKFIALLKNIVFVFVEKSELAMVKRVHGVNGFLFWMQQPAVINEKDILALQDLLEKCKPLSLEQISVNPFADNYVDTDHQEKNNKPRPYQIDTQSKIHLHSLGYAITITDEQDQESNIDKATTEFLQLEQLKSVA